MVRRRCIGLDVHREFAQVAIWQDGVVRQAGRIATTPEALRIFAETLQWSLRDGDMAARWGGEEFILILARSGAVDGREVADRVRAKLAERLLAGSIPKFTASFGIADKTMSPRLEELLDGSHRGNIRGVVAQEQIVATHRRCRSALPMQCRQRRRRFKRQRRR